MAVFLSETAGYGIYLWYVLPRVASFTVVGTVILWFSANARRHGPIWLIGASLHRLLPIIELSKEFAKPPTNENWPPNRNRFQAAFFALHAIFGWVLGLVLLAALAGLTKEG